LNSVLSSELSRETKSCGDIFCVLCMSSPHADSMGSLQRRPAHATGSLQNSCVKKTAFEHTSKAICLYVTMLGTHHRAYSEGAKREINTSLPRGVEPTTVWQAWGPAACNEEWEPANTVIEEANIARHSGGPETPVKLKGGARRKKDKDIAENSEVGLRAAWLFVSVLCVCVSI
jgi:hypothetical protein